MLSRRRFLGIAALSLASPVLAAEVQEWRGIALGSEVRIVLSGADRREARHVFAKIERVLRHVESQFSLFRDSALTRLNRVGRLANPPPELLALCELAGEVHRASGGAFDPSIQPLWRAMALGGDVPAARALVGWPRVHVSAAEIILEPGMHLTFNGIAQGHAADRVAELLQAEGFGNVLIDTGEIMALGHRPAGEPWTAAIALPDGQIIARTGLSNRALATSSPRATLIGGGRPHIIDPHGGAPLWQLASVSAPGAAVADALSTVSCLLQRSAIDAALAGFPEARLEALL